MKAQPIQPEAWCGICAGDGQVDEVRYVSTDGQELKVVPTGARKNCPGCDGKKISVKAQKWRDEHVKSITSDEVYSAEERAPMLPKMHAASDAFYRAATQIGCHPFIEFTGVMNEYIKLCEQAHAAGIDFTNANVHSGQALPMGPHNAAYLAEKLGCILGPTLHTDPEVRKAFLTGLGFGPDEAVSESD